MPTGRSRLHCPSRADSMLQSVPPLLLQVMMAG
jgi:hypothetical protein